MIESSNREHALDLARSAAEQAPSDNAGAPRFSFTEFRAVIFRQHRVMIPAIVAGPLLALGVTALMPSVYEGTVSVKIDNERTQIIQGQDIEPSVSIADTSRYLTTQSKLVKSRSLAEKVVDQLKLDRNKDFIVQMGETVRDGEGSAVVQQLGRREQAIEILRDHVDMDVSQSNRIADLIFRSRDPVLAARVANAYADAYLSVNVLQHFQTNTYARKVLTEQVAETRAKLEQTEQKAIKYARDNQLIDIGDAASGVDNGKEGGKTAGGARSITTANLVSINEAYAAAVSARVAAEQKWNAARTARSVDLPDAINSPAVQALLQARAAQSAMLAELKTRYEDSRPQVREAAAKLAEINRQIEAVASAVRNSLRTEYVEAASKEQQLGKVRQDLAAETLSEQEKRVQLNLIVRNANSLRQQLEDMIKRLDQVSSAADINTSSVSIVDRASVPNRPTSPNVVINLLVGLLVGIGAAASLAFLREMIDETLWRPEDVEMKLRQTLIGVIPWVEGDLATTLGDPKSDAAEAYSATRTTVDYFSGKEPHKVLLVTSGSPKEGKSTTSFALARSFASAGRRVLLIDLDARIPSQHKLFGYARSQPGVMECLLKGDKPERYILETDTPQLDVFPLGIKPTNPVQILSSTRVDDLISELRAQYDIIIIDTAPVMGLADAPLISRLADGVIYVAEAGRSHNGQAKVALRRIRTAGGHVIGAIITKFNVERYGYDFGYNSYYYYNYKNRYEDESGVEVRKS